MVTPLCQVAKETGQVPLKCLFDCQRSPDCDAHKQAEQRKSEPAPGTVRCKTCGSTRVYWMTSASRREAEFISRSTGNKLALRLATARLFDIDGGEHECKADDLFKDFE